MAELTAQDVRALLGMRPANRKPAPVAMSAVDERTDRDMRIRQVRIGGKGMPALCLEPAGEADRAGIGVLYCHAHGNRHEIGKAEVIEGRPAILEPPLGMALARAGATVLCPDMPGFGERLGEGSESELAMAALWNGRTLIGQMLEDLETAHDALAMLASVDPDRIAAVGISMGGTLAYMHAALRADVWACAQLCVFSGIAPMIETGVHGLHGIYMTIPGLLPEHDLGDIAALVAPRPQLICTGTLDPLTPEVAYEPARSRVEAAYAEAGYPERLRMLRMPGAGHEETPEMRQQVFDLLGLSYNNN